MERERCRYCGHRIFRPSYRNPYMCSICEEFIGKKEIEQAYESII